MPVPLTVPVGNVAGIPAGGPQVTETPFPESRPEAAVRLDHILLCQLGILLCMGTQGQGP